MWMVCKMRCKLSNFSFIQFPRIWPIFRAPLDSSRRYVGALGFTFKNNKVHRKQKQGVSNITLQGG
jgi:hypothetical protein